MFWRWLIRCALLGSFVLCGAAWAWSAWDYSQTIGITYYFPDSSDVSVRIRDGGLGLDWGSRWTDDALPSGPGFHFDYYRLLPFSDFHDAPGMHYFLGFFIDTDPRFFGGTGLFAVIPLWLPAGMLGLLTIYTWRKTGKQNPANAFPVEMKEISGKKA